MALDFGNVRCFDAWVTTAPRPFLTVLGVPVVAPIFRQGPFWLAGALVRERLWFSRPFPTCGSVFMLTCNTPFGSPYFFLMGEINICYHCLALYPCFCLNCWALPNPCAVLCAPPPQVNLKKTMRLYRLSSLVCRFPHFFPFSLVLPLFHTCPFFSMEE